VEQGTRESQTDELGDVLFTIVNLSRFLKLSPEEAMVHANQKFKSRFTFVETSVKEGHGHFDDYSLDELESFWKQAKGREKQ
jgi:tetrapyrrole methylase family protein / MazG family protein